MRRFVITFTLGYFVVAFAVIFLTMINAEDEAGLVWLAEGDAGIVVALSLFGLLAVVILAIQLLVDGKRREDLERHIREPRRKSQALPKQD